MRSTSFLIAILSLVGCASSAPKPPLDKIPYCPIVAIEGGKPYLYCQWSDKHGEKWRVPIADLPHREEKYICTSDEGYAAAYNYGKALERWTKKNCNQ